MISKHVCSEEGEEKIDETDLPTAKEITLTAEELQFINNAEEYEELQVAGSQKCNKKTALSLSRGSVGAAVVGIFNVASIILFDAGISVLCLTGGVVGGVALGVVGAVAVGGGAAYLATKSDKLDKTGEKVYGALSKTGKTTRKGIKKAKSKIGSKFGGQK